MSSLQTLPTSGALNQLAALKAAQSQGVRGGGGRQPTEEDLAARDERQHKMNLEELQAQQAAAQQLQDSRIQAEKDAQEAAAQKALEIEATKARIDAKVLSETATKTAPQKKALEEYNRSFLDLKNEHLTAVSAAKEAENIAAGKQATFTQRFGSEAIRATGDHAGGVSAGEATFNAMWAEQSSLSSDKTLAQTSLYLLGSPAVEEELTTFAEAMGVPIGNAPSSSQLREMRKQRARQWGASMNQVARTMGGRMLDGMKDFVDPDLTGEAEQAMVNLINLQLAKQEDNADRRDSIMANVTNAREEENLKILLDSGNTAAINGFIKSVSNGAQSTLDTLNTEKNGIKRAEQEGTRRALTAFANLDDRIRAAGQNAPTAEEMNSLIGAHISNLAKLNAVNPSDRTAITKMLADTGMFSADEAMSLAEAAVSSANSAIRARKFKDQIAAEDAELTKREAMLTTMQQDLKETAEQAGTQARAAEWEAVLSEMRKAKEPTTTPTPEATDTTNGKGGSATPAAAKPAKQPRRPKPLPGRTLPAEKTGVRA